MAISQAKTLEDSSLAELLNKIGVESERPVVDRAAFLLSFLAGLRVQEIAGLRWSENLLGPNGAFRTEEFRVPGAKGRMKSDVRPVLFIGSDIGKYGSSRTISMHPALVKHLTILREENIPGPWVIPGGKPHASSDIKARAHALKMRINRFYAKIGFDGCSSHSGRRTFITKAARTANNVGCSLADVQKMAGHRQLVTTQAYIDISMGQSDLVNALYQ
jgi:integrase